MIGRKDQRVTFQESQFVDDGGGGTIPTVTDVLTTFASVEQVKAGNDIETAQLTLPKTYLIKINYRSSFEPKVDNYIIYKNDKLVIKGVNQNDQRQIREYWITAISI